MTTSDDEREVPASREDHDERTTLAVLRDVSEIRARHSAIRKFEPHFERQRERERDEGGDPSEIDLIVNYRAMSELEFEQRARCTRDSLVYA